MLTLAQLNGLSCAQQNLVLLRVLFAGDGLTQMYQTLSEKTVEDLLNVSDAILQMADKDEVGGIILDGTYLTEEEKAEYLYLIENMRVYADA